MTIREENLNTPLNSLNKDHSHTQSYDSLHLPFDEKENDLKQVFRALNSLDKVKTSFKIAGLGVLIPFGEVSNFLYSLKNGLLKDYVKLIPTNLLFRLALGLTGIKLNARFQFKTLHCRETQKNLLLKIIRENQNTLFGKKHNFSKIKSVGDFQQNVPIQKYDDLKPYIDQHIKGIKGALVNQKIITYATTSGSTGEPKFIPITQEAQKNSHSNVGRLWAYTMMKERPATFRSKILAIVSPAEEGKMADGTSYGSTSGQLIKGMNKGLRKKYVLPYEVYTIENYDAKYYTILRMGMSENISFLSTANPSTLTLIARKGNEWKYQLIQDIEYGTLNRDLKIEDSIRQVVEQRLSPNKKLAAKLRACIRNDDENKLRPQHYWPHIAMISCWTGGNSQTFIREMSKWYGKNVPLRDLGYLASEIRGTIPLTSQSNAGALTITENFFEFVSVEDMELGHKNFKLADELEVGKRYYIFFTTKAGLYRYNINDIVEVKGFVNNTPTIVFIQKGKGVTNITGEKLYEQQLMDSVVKAEKELNVETDFYLGLAQYEQSRYDLFVEFKNKHLRPNEKAQFIGQVEDNLQKLNMEYATKRKSLRLSPIRLQECGPGSLDNFKAMRLSQGVREAQFKVIPLTADAKLIQCLNVIGEINTES